MCPLPWVPGYLKMRHRRGKSLSHLWTHKNANNKMLTETKTNGNLTINNYPSYILKIIHQQIIFALILPRLYVKDFSETFS